MSSDIKKLKAKTRTILPVGKSRLDLEIILKKTERVFDQKKISNMAGYISVGVYDEDTISLELWFFFIM